MGLRAGRPRAMGARIRKALIRVLRRTKKFLVKTESAAEAHVKRWLGLRGPAGNKPYIRPWDVEVLPPITTVADIAKRHCSGCGACANLCPAAAISMEPDSEGFLYPHVDGAGCNGCGLCARNCPSYSFTAGNEAVSDCYALCAADNEVRLRSSSGGAFALLAGYVLERGGHVCGAAYDEDFTVRHVLVSDVAEIPRLQGSKYVQSDTGRVFTEIKTLLASGEWVLFSGCPCQVAGLLSYLGKAYETLITVDLICHGVPSPAVLRRYLQEDHGHREIERIDFRDKSAFGWSTHMTVYYKDGSVYREKCSRDPYYRMFLPCLAMRPFCSICKYAAIPRVADFSIGDWWGIEKYAPELNDGNGTSLVLANNARARRILESLRGKTAQLSAFKIDDARPRNYTIDRPFRAHPHRDRFFRLLGQYSLDKAVEYGIQRRFDVGLYGLWYGRNYGSMATYFALHQVLESLGLSVLMITNPLAGKRPKLTRSHPLVFAAKHYEISAHYPLGKLHELNRSCDAFVVGSDQMWNYDLSQSYGQSYFLDFVSHDRKRIAYATSFGKAKYGGPERARIQSASNLSRFDYVSVREEFSRDLCRDLFGIDAQVVCDPVFLCDRIEYDGLIATLEPVCSEDYLLAYVLDPSPGVGEALAGLAEKTGLTVRVVLDEAPSRALRNREELGLDDDSRVIIQEEPTIEEWLWLFRHCTAVVTDSFHGTSFAIIFEKRFLSLINHRRGGQRFISLLSRAGLTDRMIKNPAEITAESLLRAVDFSEAEMALEEQKALSLEWLKHALFAPKGVGSYCAYPVMDSRAP